MRGPKPARTWREALLRRLWTVPIGGPGCWQWAGKPNHWGYPTAGRGAGGTSSNNKRAHRLAYEELVGPIPDGMELDHLCRNKMCVSPDHLEPVTREENLARRGRIGPSLNARTGRYI